MYAEIQDMATGLFVNGAGTDFLVDTLPITTGAEGRFERIAGLPAAAVIRFKMVATGDDVVVNGFYLILS
jgi:hypothetical protein